MFACPGAGRLNWPFLTVSLVCLLFIVAGRTEGIATAGRTAGRAMSGDGVFPSSY